MEATQEKYNKITDGPIARSMLLFFLPIMAGNFFQQLYNTTDAVIVGQYVGKEALPAVGGTTGTIINLFLAIFIGLSSGFSVVISQYYGSKAFRQVNECVHTAVGFAVLSGALVSIFGAVFTPVFLSFMNVPDEILILATPYLRIYFIGMFANMIYNMCAGIIRAVGDSKRPLYFLIIACLTNIALDLLFVVVFKWGVFGAAVATVISQAISAILSLGTLIMTRQEYKLSLAKIHINVVHLKKMLNIGIAAALQSSMYALANIYIQSQVNTFGTDTISGYTAYVKMDTIFWMFMQSLGITVTTFVGQNFGAANTARVKKIMRTGFIISISIAAVIVFATLNFGSVIMTIFTKDATVIEKGMGVARITVPGFLFYSLIEIYTSSLRGVGDTWNTMIISALGICVLRVLWVMIMFGINKELFFIVSAYPLSWGVTAVLYMVYFHVFSRLKKWLNAPSLSLEKR